MAAARASLLTLEELRPNVPRWPVGGARPGLDQVWDVESAASRIEAEPPTRPGGPGGAFAFFLKKRGSETRSVMGRVLCSGLAKMDCGPSERRVEEVMVERATEERMEADEDLSEPLESEAEMPEDMVELVEEVTMGGGRGARCFGGALEAECWEEAMEEGGEAEPADSGGL